MIDIECMFERLKLLIKLIRMYMNFLKWCKVILIFWEKYKIKNINYLFLYLKIVIKKF